MGPHAGRATGDRDSKMMSILAVSPPETIGFFSSHSSPETKSETRHPKTSANLGVSPETTSETKPQIVSSSRLFSLLEKAERDDEARRGAEGSYL
jgi:hypothetical protein